MMPQILYVDDKKYGCENLTRILQEYCPKVELLGEAAILEASHMKITV